MAETKVTGNELSGSIPVNRQNDTTSVSVPGARIEAGWGVITVNTGVATYVEGVTFGTAFTVPPIVVITFGGDNITASGAAYGNGGSNIEAVVNAKAYSITTAGFQAYIGKPNLANYGANGFAYYQWIAIGV